MIDSAFIHKINKLFLIENLPIYIDKYSLSMDNHCLYVEHFPCEICGAQAIVIRDKICLCIDCMGKENYYYIAKYKPAVDI